MESIPLTKEQMAEEGYYSPEWFKKHGARDKDGNLIYDKNGKPVAAIQHEDGRDNYSVW